MLLWIPQVGTDATQSPSLGELPPDVLRSLSPLRKAVLTAVCARRTRRWSRGSWYCATCDRPVRWKAYTGWYHAGPARLTTEELEREWARAAAVVGIHGPYSWGQQVAVLARMVRYPDVRDAGY